MAREELVEPPPRDTKPRVRRVQRDSDRLGNLGHRHVLKLGQHQDLSFRVVEFIEKSADKLELVSGDRQVERRGLHRVGVLLDIPVRRLSSRPTLVRAVVRAHGASHDAVEPASEVGRLLNGRKLRMHHDENLLDDVVDGRHRHGEPARAAPDEIEVLLVYGAERRDGVGANRFGRAELPASAGGICRHYRAAIASTGSKGLRPS